VVPLKIMLLSNDLRLVLFTDMSKDDFNDMAQAKSSKSKGDETQTKNKILNNVMQPDSQRD